MSPLVGWEDVAVVAPVAILASGALAVMALDAFLPSATPREGLSLVGVGVLLAALAASVASDEGSRVAFGGAVQVDAFGRAATSVISAATALALLAAQAQVARWGLPPGEVVALFLLSATAAAYLAVAADLAGVFLGIEGMSLPLYALAAIRREDPRGSEAGLKYFALGALASGLLLYGMALLYGASGTLALAGLWPSTAPPGLLAVGAALVLAGLAFKVGAVPFHWWVPDAYQGAPASVTAYMATAVKVAAFAALGRVLVLALEAGHAVWGPALWWIAAATLVLGNLLAVAQTSVKRMLAYSGIAHTGYALIG
ncbi:MAG: NADH-quinone oxidoreductase subunit N, partial [Planctomycetes bacterium]|nr:NADH-quinone oxidoreductase subunit N [Planctomycetota bacterium]